MCSCFACVFDSWSIEILTKQGHILYSNSLHLLLNCDSVGDCQPNSLEFALADPSGKDGEFDSKTAQRYLLSKGDIFQIPPGTFTGSRTTAQRQRRHFLDDQSSARAWRSKMRIIARRIEKNGRDGLHIAVPYDLDQRMHLFRRTVVILLIFNLVEAFLYLSGIALGMVRQVFGPRDWILCGLID